MTFKWLPLDSFIESHLEDWVDLSERSRVPNIYLTPGFLIPAAQHLTPNEQLYMAHVLGDEDELLMLGAFTRIEASVRYPYLRAHAYRSRHSFQSGLLIDASATGNILEEFFLGLHQQGIRAIRFEHMRADDKLKSNLEHVEQQLGWRWFTDQSLQRAMWNTQHDPLQQMSKRRIKNIERNMRRLEEALGEVDFRVIENASITSQHIDDFLHLEQSGWKRATALKSSTAGERFLRTVVDNTTASDHIFICELLAGGTTVASTINFRIGNSAFAFKVGHDDRFRKYGPGILVEYAYLKWCADYGAGYQEIDSGAMPGSYIEDLWPNRCEIQDGHLVAPGMPTYVYTCKQKLKQTLQQMSAVLPDRR